MATSGYKLHEPNDRGGHRALEPFRSKKSMHLFFNKHQLIAWDEIFFFLAGENPNMFYMKRNSEDEVWEKS